MGVVVDVMNVLQLVRCAQKEIPTNRDVVQSSANALARTNLSRVKSEAKYRGSTSIFRSTYPDLALLLSDR